MVVDIFIPCFIDQVFPNTGMNMVKILEKLGCEVHYNPKQTCCGQPGFNAGYFEHATQVAEKFVGDFPHPDRYVVAPSASCIGMIRNHYEELLKNSDQQKQLQQLQKNALEFTEFVVDVLGIEKIEGAKLEGTATYHDACGALRECGIKEAPRKLLGNVEGLTLEEMKESETCCGFGGTFAVKFQGISVGMAEQKVDNSTATQADYLISTDSSCLMHLDGYIKRNRKPIEVMHIVDVLATGW
jgi:L-lactate dehydrogenase complex protein LldE